ncbi:MAG: ATP synthase F1 subunit delta [Chloroflexi bacterium RBG_19FT_COMBO_48_23]|nr:MAG: ATP synthase F1 subunit delta [Chloroflexi bacterium RBG_19FT_COMBO_48_23]
MPITTSVKRYAQAVFEIALERNKLKEWQSDLRKIARLIQDTEFASLIENPKLPFELKAKLAQEILGKINPMALNLVYILITKGKLKDAGQLADEYERLLNDHHGIKTAEVTTAIALDNTERERLSHHLEAIIGKKVRINTQVNPDILGGFIARIDDSLIDGSIRNKLEMLKKSLAKTRR